MSTSPNTVTIAEAYFEAWRTNQPEALTELFAPDIRVNGPLGQIDGAGPYQESLSRIFGITRELVIHKRWVDGGDVITWLDMHPTGDAEPWPVASWLHIEDGRITHVRVTFDVTKLLAAGDPRDPQTGQQH